MGRLEVQGIVAAATGLPFVQFRQVADDGTVEAQWQADPAQAREMATQVQEAATNAVYDAALIAWGKEAFDDEMTGVMLVDQIRKFRADSWGLPDQPEDWR